MHNLIAFLNLASFTAHSLMIKSRKNSRIEINIVKTLIFDIHLHFNFEMYTLNVEMFLRVFQAEEKKRASLL